MKSETYAKRKIESLERQIWDARSNKHLARTEMMKQADDKKIAGLEGQMKAYKDMLTNETT